MWRSPRSAATSACPVLSEAANISNQFIPAVAKDGEGWSVRYNLQFF